MIKIALVIHPDGKSYFQLLVTAIAKSIEEVGLNVEVLDRRLLTNLNNYNTVIVVAPNLFHWEYIQQGMVFRRCPDITYVALDAEQTPYLNYSSPEMESRWLNTQGFIKAYDFFFTESEAKVAFLRSQGYTHCYSTNMGYHPCMTNVDSDSKKKIYDFFFLGILCQRRLKIIKQLEAAGKKVYPTNTPLFDPIEKAQAISQSKICLNIHNNEVGYFEKARIIHDYMANYGFTLSEKILYPENFENNKHYIGVPYEKLVEEGLAWLDRDREREDIAKKAFDFIKSEYKMNVKDMCEVISRRPVIGVGMIVKNEEEDIKDCIKSLFPFADIIYIADTGSTDNTCQVVENLCREYSWNFLKSDSLLGLKGKTVIYHEKCRVGSEEKDGEWTLWDFGAAKNVYLKALETTCDWIMTVDADDKVIEPHRIRELTTCDVDVYGFTIVDKPSNPKLQFFQHRFWKVSAKVRFEGACHEYPQWIPNSKVVDSKLRIQHRWTYNPNQEESNKRNTRILQREYENGNASLRNIFYLANCYREVGEYSKAIKLYEEYLTKPAIYHDERMFVHFYRLKCYRLLRDYQKVINYGLVALGEDQRFSEIWMELAYAYYELQNWNKCIGICIAALQPKPETMLFVEPNLYTFQPWLTMSCAYESMGDKDRALQIAQEGYKLSKSTFLRDRILYILGKL